MCDEVGMGKTAVVIATCLANRATHSRGSETQWAQMLRLLTRTPGSLPPGWTGPRLPLKATLVLTNVSLVGQWEDEFKKFAPGLRVQRFYGGGKFTKGKIGDWRDVDVLISTFTTVWKSNEIKFRAPHARANLTHWLISTQVHDAVLHRKPIRRRAHRRRAVSSYCY